MKGVIIQERLEIKLEVQGDGFAQGDLLVCTVAVKNPNDEVRSIAGLYLTLAAIPSKPKKGQEPFEIISDHRLKEGFNLSAGETVSAKVEIPLATDSRITDNAFTIQFLYGVKEDRLERPRLPITILPHKLLIQISEIFSSAFGFTDKQRKWNDGAVEIKFKPSSDKRLSLVDEVIVSCKVTSDELLMRYEFKVKSLETTAVAVKFKKDVKQFESKFLLQSILLTPTQLDTSRMEPAIEQALKVAYAGF